MHARVAGAALRRGLTAFAIGAAWTDAEEVFEQVDTAGVVETGVRVAAADVDVAALSGPSRRTMAEEAANLVDTFGTVLARRRLAFIDIDLAEFSAVAGVADATERAARDAQRTR